MPTVAVFPSDLPALQDLLVPAELALLEKGEATRGLMAVKSEGLATLRSNTQCVVQSTEKQKDGSWSVSIKRYSPRVELDGTFGDREETELQWQVLSTDGGLRVQTGLARVYGMREEIGAATAKDNYGRVLELLQTMHGVYHDPTLVFDIDWAAREAELSKYRNTLIKSPAPSLDTATGELVTTVTNHGDRVVQDALVETVFVVGDEPRIVESTLASLPPGRGVELRITPPAGEHVAFRAMHIRRLTLK